MAEDKVLGALGTELSMTLTVAPPTYSPEDPVTLPLRAKRRAGTVWLG